MIKYVKAMFLIFLFASPLLAQQAAINGTVISGEDSVGLPGVSVVVKGTTQGVATDGEGKYSISVDEGATLVFSYVGFINQEIKVGSQSRINITLRPNVSQLNEVVVTGYTTQLRKDVMGAVSTISSERIKEIPVSGMDQALQGQVAGVQVTSSSGTPGGGIKVVIRGSTSISASNRPLFIVDGVPVEDGALSQIGYGGQADNALSIINPNDIESYSVLMDASEKAQYGARAANGVVLIKTKRGKANSKTQFDIDVQRGLVDITKKVDLLNSSELLDLQREAVTNAGMDPDGLGLIDGVTDGINTKWLDEVLRTAILQQYQLSAKGGNDKTSFYLSGSYRDEEGVQINNRFQRLSGTLNLDHKATSKLTFGNNLILSRVKNKRIKSDNYLDAVYSAALQTLPYYTPYDESGNIIGYGTPGFPSLNGNPVGNAIFPRYDVFTTKVLAGLYINYAILPRLNFRSQLSIDYNSVNEDQYQPTSTIIGGNPEYVGGKGYGINAYNNLSTLISTTTLNYSAEFGSHKFQGLLGGEVLRRIERSNSVQGQSFPSDDFTYITSAGVVEQGSSYKVISGLVSGFAELRYDYNDKYSLKVAVREDGSSRFGKGRKFGFFPSGSASWRISSEPFLRDNTFINDLKLRASIGFTGNERIGDFEFLGKWTSISYNGTGGIGPSSLDNRNLQWERTREGNIGLDLSLFNSRINLSMNGYYNLTDNLLFDQPIPSTTGFGAFKGNVGRISNKGLEFALNTINVDREVKWSTNFNISRNVNRVEYLADTVPLYRGYEAQGSNGTNIIKEGEPLGTFWGLRFLGVDPATGDAMYDDVNGDGSITPDDGAVIGHATPDFIGGLTNRLSYKNFDLNIFFQFSYGNDVLNFSNTSLLNAGEDINVNQTREALKRWRKPGDITSVPKYEYKNSFNNRYSSRLIEDGSFLRLKNLTIGYNLPSRYTDLIGAAKGRIYLSGTNLWTLTNYTGGDPEVSTLDGSTSAQSIDLFTLPQTRILMLGITIGF